MEDEDVEYEMTLRVYSLTGSPHIARVAWETSDYDASTKTLAQLPAALKLALRLTQFMAEERKQVNAGKSVSVELGQAELTDAINTLNEGSPDAEEPEQPASKTRH